MLAISASSTWEIKCPLAQNVLQPLEIHSLTESDTTGIEQQEILQRKLSLTKLCDKLALICWFYDPFQRNFSIRKEMTYFAKYIHGQRLERVTQTMEVAFQSFSFLSSFLKVWQNSRSAQCTCLKLHQLKVIPKMLPNFQN